jgi:uncharacterized membrane protein
VSSPLETLTRTVEQNAALDAPATRAAAVVAPLGKGTARELLSGRFLGHALHPMLTDLPIGFWTASFVLDLVGGRDGRVWARRFIGLGLVSVPLTAMAGWSDWLAAGDAVEPEDSGDLEAMNRVGIVHAGLNGAAAATYFASYRARGKGRHARGVGLGLVGATLATAAAHLGGHLVLRLGVGTGDPAPPR